MNVLEVRGLVKRFAALAATDSVDLDLRAGEVHALIGPNGAGKTTLIAQIAGGLAPDEGSIRLGGRDVTGLPAPARARLGLARTFQITALLHGLSALDNATLAAQGALPGALSPFRRRDRAAAAEAAARAALAEVGLTARADAPAGALAHGEQRALDLAMALAQRPRALLLDEPMAGAGRDETGTLVATLRRLKGRVAMLLVEHDMSAVFALADRVSVLVAGRVVASGAPEAIRADPAVRAAYLGEDA